MFGVLELGDKNIGPISLLSTLIRNCFYGNFFRSFLMKSFDKRNLQINRLGNFSFFVIACSFYVETGMALSENDINSV